MKEHVCLLIISLCNVLTSSYKLTLDQGELLGTEQQTLSGRKVAAFLGVPFAKPPTRFQKAELPEPWKGTWNATSAHSDCMMFLHINVPKHNKSYDEVKGVEDCLYLDIYTPRLLKSGDEQLMDVIVYIYGGAFMYPYGGLHGPKYLLDEHDIVLVRINYRVGILGFLSTGDNELPGNNGLKDQSLALKWIQQNIAKFGGNPKSVTITGSSAGGASVHYHYFSSMSKDSFAKGISMSGSTFVPWGLVEQHEAKERTTKLAELVGCPSSPSKELVECLSNRPATDLVMQTRHFLKWDSHPFTTFGPVVEPEGNDRFITEEPYDLLHSGKINDLPWITAFTKDEGLYPAAEFIGDEMKLKEFVENWLDIAPHFFFYSHTAPKSRWNDISNKIKEHYFKGNDMISDIPNIIKMQGDRFFIAYIVNAAKQQANVTKSPVYTYQFSYRGKHSISEVLSGGLTNDWGACHGDDTSYVFERKDLNPQETENDRAMSKQMIDMFTTFAKTSEAKFGDVKLETVNSKSPDFKYIDIIGPGKAEIKTESDVGNEKFWLSLNLNEVPLRKELVES